MALKRWKLIEARENAGLSQEELAEELETTRVSISHWENAVTRPHPHFKRKLEVRFGIARGPLLAITDEPDEEADENAEVPRGEGRSESPMRDSLLEETKTGEALVASAAPASSTVTCCLWQPSAPLTQFIASNPARHFWQIAHTDYSTPDEMTAAIRAAIKDLNMTTGDTITRREALCELALIPMMTLGNTYTLHAKRYEEVLRFCTAALEGCWELYQGSDPVGTQHAFECVCTYVPMLETIAHDSSRLRKQALDLATRYALLQTVLGWGCIGARETTGHAQRALYLSRESGNILLQLSAHTKASWTYILGSNYVEAYNTMQEGEHVLKVYQRRKKGPLLPIGVIGNFYSSYSMAQVDNGIDADRALGIATDSKPLNGRIALIEWATIGQRWEAAVICSAKGDPKQAMEWLEKLIDTNTFALRQGLQLNEQGRFGVINTLTDALLQSKDRDMKHIIRAWTVAIEGAKALKSEQRYRDAMANLAIMRKFWPGEQAIRKLMPLTSHW